LTDAPNMIRPTQHSISSQEKVAWFMSLKVFVSLPFVCHRAIISAAPFPFNVWFHFRSTHETEGHKVSTHQCPRRRATNSKPCRDRESKNQRSHRWCMFDQIWPGKSVPVVQPVVLLTTEHLVGRLVPSRRWSPKVDLSCRSCEPMSK